MAVVRSPMHWLGFAAALACLTMMTAVTPAIAAAAPGADVLLVFDPSEPMSTLDAAGIREALAELQTPVTELELDAASPLTAERLRAHAAVMLAHVALTPSEVAAVDAWVAAGGGLVATGRSGQGLETTLGLESLQAASVAQRSEIRFGVDHPVAAGSYWAGAISQVPPMPVSEFPAIIQLLYPDGGWPAYRAEPAGARVLARWRNAGDGWFTTDGSPSVLAHEPALGRTVYLGALPGAYADPAWRYPLAWRTVISEALAWVNSGGAVIQLGYWPQAHRAALAFTADTERAEMRSVVPALLAIFESLGLQRFGTFFVVGQAGGDEGTEGAAENPEVVAQIIAAGAEVAGHGDVHTRFQGQEPALQTARIEAMRDLIEPLLDGSGEQLLGFRGPGLAIDGNTIAGLVAAGLAYDSSEHDVWNETTLPHFLGGVWRMPATSPMDFALLEAGDRSGDEWELLTRDKLDYVLSRRGMFNWITHPWVIADQLDRVESMLGDIRDRGDVWMRRLDDLLYWWLQREDLRIELLHSDTFRIRLQVSNVGDTRIDGASVWLRLPPRTEPWRAALDGEPLPLVERLHGNSDANDTAFEVAVIPALSAGSAVMLELAIERPVEVFADGFDG